MPADPGDKVIPRLIPSWHINKRKEQFSIPFWCFTFSSLVYTKDPALAWPFICEECGVRTKLDALYYHILSVRGWTFVYHCIVPCLKEYDHVEP